MTKLSFGLAAVLFVLMIALFVSGIGSTSTGLMVAALFLAGPGFCFFLGLGVGRATSEFSLVRRDETAIPTQTVNSRPRRRHEPMS